MLVKLRIRKIKPVVVEGQICDHEIILPDVIELQEALAPILERNPEPAAEVIIEEDSEKETIHIAIPLSGEFEPQYTTPSAKEGVERAIFRTRIKTKKVRSRKSVKDN